MADVIGNLGRVVIDEVTDPVMRDAAKLRPGAKRTDRRLLARWEYPAKAEADDVRKLAFRDGRYWRFHIIGCTSTAGEILKFSRFRRT